jgi:hypothetical protein
LHEITLRRSNTGKTATNFGPIISILKRDGKSIFTLPESASSTGLKGQASLNPASFDSDAAAGIVTHQAE